MNVSICIKSKTLRYQGIEIVDVYANSLAFNAGIRRGDRLLCINKKKVRDEIDYRYRESDSFLKIEVLKSDKEIYKAEIYKDEDEDIGIELSPMKIKRCANRCIFCFIDQLPEGLRPTLYIKDEDYRYSFLFGNYITTANLSLKEKRRIFEQRLSPLYISVHSTNNELRKFIIGNNKSPDILETIDEFASHRIRMHLQIVICPGINDGNELRQTIEKLRQFYPFISSIGIVPVGITIHRDSLYSLKEVDESCASQIIEEISHLQEIFMRESGYRWVFLADEFYIKAGANIPPLEHYEDLPQIENGIGMASLFLDEFKHLLADYHGIPSLNRKGTVITGRSFAPYLKDILSIFKGLEVVSIENRFFGSKITVAGLITGRDILNILQSSNIDDDSVIMIPSNMISEREGTFLDDITLTNLRKESGREVRIVEATGKGLFKEVIRLSQ
ncbi:MAG: DUF512 domain-containing protein [Nitrospirota bacterium]